MTPDGRRRRGPCCSPGLVAASELELVVAVDAHGVDTGLGELHASHNLGGEAVGVVSLGARAGDARVAAVTFELTGIAAAVLVEVDDVGFGGEDPCSRRRRGRRRWGRRRRRGAVPPPK